MKVLLGAFYWKKALVAIRPIPGIIGPFSDVFISSKFNISCKSLTPVQCRGALGAVSPCSHSDHNRGTQFISAAADRSSAAPPAQPSQHSPAQPSPAPPTHFIVKQRPAAATWPPHRSTEHGHRRGETCHIATICCPQRRGAAGLGGGTGALHQGPAS